jgi:glycosyltransferase involved in cell wall biosynthesis
MHKTGKKDMFRNYPEVKKIIYIGGLSENRGAGEMIKSVQDLNQKVKLVIVGRVSKPVLESELKACSKEKIEFIGEVPYEEIPSWLSKADIGIICYHPTPNNLISGYSNTKLFEYMAAGLPIVASNFPFYREIIEGNKCGITINPLDPSEISAALEYLVEHPEEISAMGENGKKAILQKYNWENESLKLLDLYKSLLA